MSWPSARPTASASCPGRPAGGLPHSPAALAAAAAHGTTPDQIALAWLLHRSPALLPIPGTSSLEHLRENVGAALIELSADELAELGRAA